MSLLREIQEAAVSNVPVSTTLRRCKVLAARLDSRPLRQWIQWESDGYPKDAPLPEYRVIRHFTIKGHFSGPFGSGLSNAEIPLVCIPKHVQPYCTPCELRQSISAFEELLASEKGDFQAPILPDVVLSFTDRVYRGMNCLAAWCSLPRTAVTEILNAVRNRVLDFALEIERLEPNAAEAEVGKPLLAPRQVNNVFKTIIYGGAATVVGTSDGSSITTLAVVQYNLGSLRTALKAIGVEPADIAELEKAIKQEPRPADKGKFGPKVAGWLGRMAQKAATGAWDVATGVAMDTLVRYIKDYYGLGA